MKKIMSIIIGVFSVFLVGIPNAATLVLSSIDPVMDQSGASPDIIEMRFVFDNITGDYTIGLQTSNADPFQGSFRININLFNVDVGTTADAPSFFQDVFNDISLPTPTEIFTLTGNNTRLTAWNEGDRILLNNYGPPSCTPHPDGGTCFASGVGLLPYTGFDDYIGVDHQIDVLAAVPIPAAIWLFGSGMMGLIGIARRKTA
jgi:hypothetical protein